MASSIGVVLTNDLVAGLVRDNRIPGEIRRFPDDEHDSESLLELPAEALCQRICEEVLALGPPAELEAIGVAVPGIVRDGTLEDSPNLAQLKGSRLADMLSPLLGARGVKARPLIMNDADAVAAGVAATRGEMERLTRVWTIGNGIGFGRYPFMPGVWELGHTVVTLDPRENFCGCGGRGHLEGIMGYRAMRLRFLDMEPEEVFAAAREGNPRCRDFVELWHRALAAATATAIHVGGPGRFYYTGRNIGFLDLELVQDLLHDMVKMSPLQSYKLEVLPDDRNTAVIGAAAAAESRLSEGAWRSA